MFKLPVDYTKLHWTEKEIVREQYTIEQGNKCMYCKEPLDDRPLQRVLNLEINWDLFPPDFLKYPIHLQHCRKTDMTEGAIHAYCNAALWQYENK